MSGNLKPQPFYSNHEYGFELFWVRSWSFIRIVKYTVWGHFGKGSWLNRR